MLVPNIRPEATEVAIFVNVIAVDFNFILAAALEANRFWNAVEVAVVIDTPDKTCRKNEK